MSSPMRVGIVGFGRLAELYYIPALRRISDVVVSVVADPSAARRALAAKMLTNVRTFETQTQMLSEMALDGVLIASPPAAHLDSLTHLVDRPAVAGFVEKPLVSPGSLDPLHTLPRDVRDRVMVNFNRRFWPRYQQIAAIVREGRVGALQSVELQLEVDVAKWLAVTSHRLDKDHGGALYDLGSQLIDLAGVMVGERPERIRAENHNPDQITIHLHFKNTAAEVRCRVAYASPTRERIIVRGSEGVVRIDDPNMAVHFGDNASLNDRAVDFFTIARHAALRHTSMSRMTIELALRAFSQSWRSNQPMTPGFDDGLFNAMALAAAHRSLGSGKIEPIETTSAEATA